MEQSQGDCKTRFRSNLIIILQWEHIFKATDAVQQKSPDGALCPSCQVKGQTFAFCIYPAPAVQGTNTDFQEGRVYVSGF